MFNVSLTPSNAGAFALATIPIAACFYVYLDHKRLVLWVYKTVVTSRKEKKGKKHLQGAYAPLTGETALSELKDVKGTIPTELNGMYIRNGPNPAMPPLGGYHIFDGDGMVHAIRIKEGKASYCNRYVDTARLRTERAAGFPIYSKLGDLFGFTGLAILMMNNLMKALNIIDKTQGTGTGNTTLVYHAKKLLALHEGDLPYQLRALCNGVLENVNRLKINGWDTVFTAHPKVDPETGKLHFFGYNGHAPPYVQYGQLGADGSLEAVAAVNLPEPVMMHDFCITRNYAVFFDCPLVIDPKVMVKENRLPIVFKDTRNGRMGLLPLGANSDKGIQWFDLPPFLIFHTANAWEEEDGTVKAFACHFKQMSLELEEPNPDMQHMYQYTLDPKTGKATCQMISPVSCDFPVIHPALMGRKTTYTYTGSFADGNNMEFVGIAKMQLHGLPEGQADACVGQILLPEGCKGGEPMFVPRHKDPALCDGEDDGFLLLVVYHPNDNISRLHIFDAKTMAPEPLALVTLPHRVPFGFHGYYIREDQIKEQEG